MKAIYILFILFVCNIFFHISLNAQETVDVGFETSVPSGWSSEKGNLSISPDHYKEGSNSLKWEFEKGDILRVENLQNQGLVKEEVDGYYFNTFRMWVYSTQAIYDDSVMIEFYDDKDVLQYYYYFYPNFKGWRSVAISYRYEMFGEKKSTNLQKMHIKAPAKYKGEFFFDYIDWTTGRVSGAASYHLPYKKDMGGGHWSNMMNYEKLEKNIPLTEPSSQELSDLNKIKNDFYNYAKGSSPSASQVNDAVNRYNALKISYRSSGEIKGFPLFGGDYPDSKNISVINDLILTFARDYKHTLSLNSKRKFIILVKHTLDQGYAKGSLMETVHHIGYDFRQFPLAVFIMEDVLREEGIWEDARDMAAWFIALEGIWEPGAEVSNMDAGNTRSIARFGACLYQDGEAKQVQYLKAYKQYVERWAKLYPRKGEGLKPDYTGFHHNFFYGARYVFPAYNSLSFTINKLHETSFQVNEKAKEVIKKSMLIGRIIAGGKDMPVSLAGRGSILTNIGSIISGSKVLAQSYTPADKQLAELSNYYQENSFSEYGKETNPNGFWQFNFSPLGVYRQENWVADIKGFNNVFIGSEIYFDAGRFARYYSYGAVEVIYEGGNSESGKVENGWDWNIIPGTTTIHLPFDKIEAENDRQDESTLSEFAGALRFGNKDEYYLENEPQLEGTSGIYGMNFIQKKISTTHNPSFTFRKSMFCIDGKIVCLGSGINNDDSQFPTRTNLFQTYLKQTTNPVIVNGSSKTTYPYSETLASGNSNWIIDPYGTGFYVDKNYSVTVNKKNQISPDESGNGKTTNANFATAYIEHGMAPNNAEYEFVIVPNATTEKMEELATSPESVFKILQKNNSAHIIEKENWQAHVLFEANNNLSTGRIISNSANCLVISELKSENLVVAVSDPAINFDQNGDAQPEWLELEFKGRWELSNGNSKVEILGYNENSTKFKLELFQGDPTDFELSPASVKVKNLGVIQDAFMQNGSSYNISSIRVEETNKDGYLQFDLSNITDSILSLQLQMTCLNSSEKSNISVYLGNGNNWNENNLSDQNKPSEDILLASLDTTFVSEKTYYWNLNFSEKVEKDKLSLIVKNLTDGSNISFISKENTLYPDLGAKLIVITDKAENITSFSYQNKNDNILVYPNPFSNEINIHIEGSEKIQKFDIYNSNSTLLFSKNVSLNLNNTISINTDNYVPGIYFLIAYGENSVKSFKLIKSN